MLKSIPQDYRNHILDYFGEKDRLIYSILEEHKRDLRFPFLSVYNLYNIPNQPVDVVAFISSCILFNRYKKEIRDKSSYGIPKRGEVFLERIINEGKVQETMIKFNTAVYVSYQMIESIKKDLNFDWFMNKPTYHGGEIIDSEFIIVDLANIHRKILEYKGRNSSLIYFRDRIVQERSLSKCIKEFINHIVNELNDNGYKFIFVSPVKIRDERNFDEMWYLYHVDCTEYIGSKCSEETFSNEVDDTFLMMLYDYCSYKYGVQVSILSGDNYDFAMITQDYSEDLRRAAFENDKPPTVISWEDIQYERPGFSFGPDNRLTVFEEYFFRNN